MAAPVCIAELCGNHRGEMLTAVRMVEIVARYCTEHFQLDGEKPVPVVKFQKRTPALSPDDYTRPHPNPHHAYGETYGAHREALEFSAKQHRALKVWAEACGARYAVSVWDLPAAREMMALEPEWLKVPSACNLDWRLLGLLCAEYTGDIHISLGMTTRPEVHEIARFMRERGALGRTVFYACTSGYPVDFDDIRLDEIDWIRDTFPGLKGVGFSGHHFGIDVDMAAASKGVDYIERHFTLNRTWKGTDHSASLEPDGFRKLMRGVDVVSRAMGKKSDGLLDIECAQRLKLKVEAA